MYVYRTTGYQFAYEVGYYAPNGEWVKDSSWGRFQENEVSDDKARDCAAQRVHWLNGGNDK